MTYNINYSNALLAPITITTGTVNRSTSIGLVGQNVYGYGQIFAENFLHLLENFAHSAPPANPVRGQLWFNTGTSQLSAYDGSWSPVGIRTRTNFSVTPPSLVNGGSAFLDVQAYRTYALSKISTSAPARVRLYTDSASRAADSSRGVGISAAQNSGLITEAITTGGALTSVIAPAVIGYNGDPSSKIMYITLTNYNTTTSINTVTVTVLQLEA